MSPIRKKFWTNQFQHYFGDGQWIFFELPFPLGFLILCGPPLEGKEKNGTNHSGPCSPRMVFKYFFCRAHNIFTVTNRAVKNIILVNLEAGFYFS